MSSEKNRDTSAEQSLMTLDQLSQTIEVMTGVVNRLKRHLNMQLTLNATEIEQTVDLNRELLLNERELLELQQLADQQRNSVLGIEMSAAGMAEEVSPAEPGQQDSPEPAENRHEFVIEISRPDDTDESIFDKERVLH